jgi:hypothetical protein
MAARLRLCVPPYRTKNLIKDSGRKWTEGRVTRGWLFVCVVLVNCVPASANSVRASGDFASIDGTSCSVGGMTFSFNGTPSLGGGWTSSSLFSTPTTNGFTTEFSWRPQSIAANNGCGQQDVFDELGPDFNVTAPQGFYFSGVGVSSAAHIGAMGPFRISVWRRDHPVHGGRPGTIHHLRANLPDRFRGLAASQPFSSTDTVDAEVFDLIASRRHGILGWLPPHVRAGQ